MWAQLIKSRVKPGKEGEIDRLSHDLEESQGQWSGGWRRMYLFRNQKSPEEYYTLVIFESEEAARRNEQSPEQAERLQRIQEVFEAPPEYVDLIQVVAQER